MTDVFQRRYEQFLFKNIAPKGASLPNFAKIVADAAHLGDRLTFEKGEESDATQGVLRLFRAILKQFNFNPILLEIAAIKDQRELRRTGANDMPDHWSFFVSYLVSYLPQSEARLLIRAWDASVKDLTTGRFAIVPDPEVYLSVDHRVPLGLHAQVAFHYRKKLNELTNWTADDSADAGLYAALTPTQREQLAPLPFELMTDVAGATARRRYDFHAQPASTNELVKRTIKQLARGTLFHLLAAHDGERATKLARYLAGSHMFVIPFRRQIQFPFARAEDEESHRLFGANPGGCVFGIVSKPPELQRPPPQSNESSPQPGSEPEEQRNRFERAIERISWLAQQASLLEGDATSEIERRVGDEITERVEFSRHLVVNSYVRTEYWIEGLRRLLPQAPQTNAAFRRVSDSIDNLLCLNECAIKRERRLKKLVSLKDLVAHLRSVYFTEHDESPPSSTGPDLPQFPPDFTRDLYMVLANLADNARKVADDEGVVAIGCFRVPLLENTVVWIENTGDRAMPESCQAYLRGEDVPPPRRQDGSEPLGLRTIVNTLRARGLPLPFVASPFRTVDASARAAALVLSSVDELPSIVRDKPTGTRVELTIPFFCELPINRGVEP